MYEWGTRSANKNILSSSCLVMSVLKYLSQVDPHYRDSQLPDPNGPLARAVPLSAISVANESVSVSLESNKKAAKRGVYHASSWL